MPVGEKQTLRFGPFLLDPECGQLRKNGVGLKLQGQPIQILEMLLEKPGQLVTREEIRARLWASGTFVDFDHSLNSAIKKLRLTLGEDADSPQYIETLPKRGYRFIAQVEAESPLHQNSDGTQLLEPNIATRAGAIPAADTSSSKKEYARRAPRTLSVATISIVGMFGIAVVLYWITAPLPVPRLGLSHAITKSGFKKNGLGPLQTDGTSIYFGENRPSGPAVMQVRNAGGEASQVAVPDVAALEIRNVSSDGSEMLLTAYDPKTKSWGAWIQPLPAGPWRLVSKDAGSPVWTPDNRSILFIQSDHKSFLSRVNRDGTNSQLLGEVPGGGFGLEISPDGKRVRFGGPGYSLWEANSDGSNVHEIFTHLKGRFLPGKWSPDGRYYFFAKSTGYKYDLWVFPERRHWWQRGKQSPKQLTFGPMSIGPPIVSSDGRRLYAIGMERRGELSVYQAKSEQFVPYLGGIAACYVNFSRDGKWIAYVSFPEGSLWRSRIDGTERMQLTVPPVALINPRWSPDGKMIAFTDVSTANRNDSRIYVVNAEGGGPLLLASGGDPTWSADGKSIAYDGTENGSHGIRIMNLETRSVTTVPDSADRWHPHWSPDGKYLLALGPIGHNPGMFRFADQQWEQLSAEHFDWPCWSHDSKFVYAFNWITSSVERIEVSTHKKEKVARLGSFQSTAFYFWDYGWWGLTPDDQPISTRDTGIDEIYAFDLQYD